MASTDKTEMDAISDSKTDKETAEERMLRVNRVDIVKDVEPKGIIIDTLFEDGFLTENDIELVKKGETRRDRCHRLLSMLSRRGPDGYQSFHNALKRGEYFSLANQLAITDTAENSKTEFVQSPASSDENICKGCRKFIDRLTSKKKLANRTLCKLMRTMCCSFLHNIEPKDVIDQLCQDDVISVESIDEILAPCTRIDRCEMLFEILLSNASTRVIKSLKRALKGKYGYVLRTMTEHNKCHTSDKRQIGKRDLFSSIDDSKYGDYDTESMSIEKPDAPVKRIKLDDEHKDCKLFTTATMPKCMSAICSRRQSRYTAVAFDLLSTLVNKCEFAKFEELSSRLLRFYPANYDLTCIIGYLHASKDIFKINFESAKSTVDSQLALVGKTSNPHYFTFELCNVLTRIHLFRKQFQKLQTSLDETLMMAHSNPSVCRGRAAGWFYLNFARFRISQMSCLNFSKPNVFVTYEENFKSSKVLFEKALFEFQAESGKEGPFGYGYALCRLAILLLRCGDNGLTMNVIHPQPEDIKLAGSYLHNLEDSEIEMTTILEINYRIAKCDYHFRMQQYKRALEQAQEAHELSSTNGFLEFKEHAYNRLSTIRTKPQSVSVKEFTEEQATEFLFQEIPDDQDSLDDKTAD